MFDCVFTCYNKILDTSGLKEVITFMPKEMLPMSDPPPPSVHTPEIKILSCLPHPHSISKYKQKLSGFD